MNGMLLHPAILANLACSRLPGVCSGRCCVSAYHVRHCSNECIEELVQGSQLGVEYRGRHEGELGRPISHGNL